MKTILPLKWNRILSLIVVTISSAGFASADTTPAPARVPAAPVAPAPPPTRTSVTIEAVAPPVVADADADATWLGVYAEEASEALGAQLGLKTGEGLVITYVAPDSPAAKAGLRKFDVLVAMGDQLLVHPAQLAKLIQSHAVGDEVQLELYRQGQKQTVPATLTKRPATGFPRSLVFPATWNWATDAAAAAREQVQDSMRHLHEEMQRVGADRQRVQAELERSLEKARQALQEALRHKAPGGAALGLDAHDVEALAQGEASLGENATVVVKKREREVQTIVQTDDAGSLVIVAAPRKRLTAQDKDGKIIFDGEIETPEQQSKVPSELWKKVQPLLEQFKPLEGEAGKPRAEFDLEPQS